MRVEDNLRHFLRVEVLEHAHHLTGASVPAHVCARWANEAELAPTHGSPCQIFTVSFVPATTFWPLVAHDIDGVDGEAVSGGRWPRATQADSPAGHRRAPRWRTATDAAALPSHRMTDLGTGGRPRFGTRVHFSYALGAQYPSLEHDTSTVVSPMNFISLTVSAWPVRADLLTGAAPGVRRHTLHTHARTHTGRLVEECEVSCGVVEPVDLDDVVRRGGRHEHFTPVRQPAQARACGASRCVAASRLGACKRNAL